MFIATKTDNIPNVVWIWQVSNLSLYSVAVQLKPVRQFSWSPKEHLLSILTENNKVYIISPKDASVCPILTDSNVNLSLNRLVWSSDGKSFIVGDRSYMFIGCPVIGNEDEKEDESKIEEMGLNNNIILSDK